MSSLLSGTIYLLFNQICLLEFLLASDKEVMQQFEVSCQGQFITLLILPLRITSSLY